MTLPDQLTPPTTAQSSFPQELLIHSTQGHCLPRPSTQNVQLLQPKAPHFPPGCSIIKAALWHQQMPPQCLPAPAKAPGAPCCQPGSIPCRNHAMERWNLGWKGPEAQLSPPLQGRVSSHCPRLLWEPELLSAAASFINTLHIHLPPHFYGGNSLKSFWKCRQAEPPPLPLPVTPSAFSRALFCPPGAPSVSLSPSVLGPVWCCSINHSE